MKRLILSVVALAAIVLFGTASAADEDDELQLQRMPRMHQRFTVRQNVFAPFPPQYVDVKKVVRRYVPLKFKPQTERQLYMFLAGGNELDPYFAKCYDRARTPQPGDNDLLIQNNDSPMHRYTGEMDDDLLLASTKGFVPPPPPPPRVFPPPPPPPMIVFTTNKGGGGGGWHPPPIFPAPHHPVHIHIPHPPPPPAPPVPPPPIVRTRTVIENIKPSGAQVKVHMRIQACVHAAMARLMRKCRSKKYFVCLKENPATTFLQMDSGIEESSTSQAFPEEQDQDSKLETDAELDEDNTSDSDSDSDEDEDDLLLVKQDEIDSGIGFVNSLISERIAANQKTVAAQKARIGSALDAAAEGDDEEDEDEDADDDEDEGDDENAAATAGTAQVALETDDHSPQTADSELHEGMSDADTLRLGGNPHEEVHESEALDAEGEQQDILLSLGKGVPFIHTTGPTVQIVPNVIQPRPLADMSRQEITVTRPQAPNLKALYDQGFRDAQHVLTCQRFRCHPEPLKAVKKLKIWKPTPFKTPKGPKKPVGLTIAQFRKLIRKRVQQKMRQWVSYFQSKYLDRGAYVLDSKGLPVPLKRSGNGGLQFFPRQRPIQQQRRR